MDLQLMKLSNLVGIQQVYNRKSSRQQTHTYHELQNKKKINTSN